jgi:hypothetical protein
MRSGDPGTDGGSVVCDAPDDVVQVGVRPAQDTVQQSPRRMADLFGPGRAATSSPLRSVCRSGDLERQATVAGSATVRHEGRRRVVRRTIPHSLAAALSVGYRVNSRRGTHFRVWPTAALLPKLISGALRVQDADRSVEQVA